MTLINISTYEKFTIIKSKVGSHHTQVCIHQVLSRKKEKHTQITYTTTK